MGNEEMIHSGSIVIVDEDNDKMMPASSTLR